MNTKREKIRDKISELEFERKINLNVQGNIKSWLFAFVAVLVSLIIAALASENINITTVSLMVSVFFIISITLLAFFLNFVNKEDKLNKKIRNQYKTLNK